MSQITIEPIKQHTLNHFAEFLHVNMRQDRTVDQWFSELNVSWQEERPNYGFMLKDGENIVGGIGAFYKTRVINTNIEKFCNITSWCVLDTYRQHSMRLALSVINQPGYNFTDFTPTQVVGTTLKFFKFEPLDDRQVVILNLPWHPFDKGKVLDRREDIERALSGDALQIYKDHAIFPWLNHILVGKPGNYCHIIFKKKTFKGMPAAFIYHLSDQYTFSKYSHHAISYLFFKGYISSHVEYRFLKKRPWPFKIRSGFNAKLFLSKTLTYRDIDYLYSELMALNC